MVRHCRGCGSEVRDAAKFCMACGATVDLPLVYGQATAPPASRKNWFSRHKLLTGIGALATLVVIASAASNSGSDEGSSGPTATVTEARPTATESNRLFAGRLDAQPEDQERNLGEAANIDGFEATTKAAAFQPELSAFEKDGYIVVDISHFNASEKTEQYNTFQWKVQLPSGVVLDAWDGAGFTQDTLSSGDLVAGGHLDSKIIWEVGAERGDFYIIWKPKAFDAARGIWKVTI